MASLKVGRQLQAARVLAGYDRTQLAEAAGLAVVTVKRLELQDRVTAHSTTLDALEKALEAAGVEFTNGDQPGVRLRAPTAA
jgi:transcriptional regulator with XRE-family HTH domain